MICNIIIHHILYNKYDGKYIKKLLLGLREYSQLLKVKQFLPIKV